MAVDSPLGPRTTVAALLALTAATGLVDAVCYLRLGHVFAANMTGNVVFLGLAVLPGSGLAVAGPIVSTAAFLAGAFLGGRVGAQLDDRPDRWLGLAFAVEAAVLAVLAVLTGTGVLHPGLVVLALLAAAFGLQNSTVRRLGAPDLTTTVLTQTLAGLAADNAWAGGDGARPHRRLGSVLAMFGGAALGAALLQVTFAGVVALAAAVVGTVALVFGLRLGADRVPAG